MGVRVNRSTAMVVAEREGLTLDEFTAARHRVAREVFEAGQRYQQVMERTDRERQEAREALQRSFEAASKLGFGCDLIAKCTAEADLLRDTGLKAKPDRPTAAPVVTFATVHRWLKTPLGS